MEKNLILKFMLSLICLFMLESCNQKSSVTVSSPAIPAAPTPISAATALAWTTTGPSTTLAVHPSWTLATGGTIASQSIQYYSDAACGTLNGAPITLSGSATTDNFSGSDATSYSYKITSYPSGSGSAVTSACSSAMFVNTCVGAKLTNAPYAAGSGTTVDPILICTGAQMNAIGLTTADWTKTFVLGADIDLSAYTGTMYNIIGNSTTNFTGVFDGNNHIIANFSLTNATSSYVGLFGFISGSTSELKNLTLTNVNVSATNTLVYLGTLVGRLNAGRISNCSVTGTLTQTAGINTQFVGGLAGVAASGATISNSVSNISFPSGFAALVIGGLTANLLTSTISGSSFTGNVHASADILTSGGISGTLTDSTVSNSFSTGNLRSVHGSGNVGGLVGSMSGAADIMTSYSTGILSANVNYVGGLVGSLGSSAGHGVFNSYSTSPVSSSFGGASVGGLIGRLSTGVPTITNCYASGTVGLTGSSIGGLVGSDNNGGVNYGIYMANFWDNQVNALPGLGAGPVPAGMTGANTATMKTPITFSTAGWTSPTWNLTTTGIYLKLGWQP